jgi:SnoaL-like domain
VLSDYYSAFDQNDTCKLIKLHDQPAVFITPDSTVAIQSREGIAGWLKRARDRFPADFCRSKLVNLRIALLGKRFAVASGTDIKFDRTAVVAARLDLTYVLHRTAEGWKIAVVIQDWVD